MAFPAPNIENLTVVLVGAFNPAIFHPEWFLRQEMISLADFEAAKTEVVSMDISRCVLAGLALEVVQDRLILMTRDRSKEGFLQDTIHAILAKLPHTPIRACGLNSVLQFDLGDEAYWHRIGHTLVPKETIWNDLLEQPGLELLTVKGKREGGFPGHVSISVQPSPKFIFGLQVASNTHFGTKSQEPLPTENFHEYIASEWKEAYQITRKTAEMIFKRVPKHV